MKTKTKTETSKRTRTKKTNRTNRTTRTQTNKKTKKTTNTRVTKTAKTKTKNTKTMTKRKRNKKMKMRRRQRHAFRPLLEAPTRSAGSGRDLPIRIRIQRRRSRIGSATKAGAEQTEDGPHLRPARPFRAELRLVGLKAGHGRSPEPASCKLPPWHALFRRPAETHERVEARATSCGRQPARVVNAAAQAPEQVWEQQTARRLHRRSPARGCPGGAGASAVAGVASQGPRTASRAPLGPDRVCISARRCLRDALQS